MHFGALMSSDLSLFERAQQHRERTAIGSAEGEFSYAELLDASQSVASLLLGGRRDLEGRRVAFLVPPGFDYVATQWGIWRAGGIAVPLALSYPPAELAYVLDDAEADTIVVHPDLLPRVAPLAAKRDARVLSTAACREAGAAELPIVTDGRAAMILYTSGTTGRPKGVVITHRNIVAQVEALVTAWGWRQDDRILLVLPLHHVHGIINVLTCALWSGARCDVLPRFDADEVWHRFESGMQTVFMAVPTVYRRLIGAWEDMPPERQPSASRACADMRLMVSGSAALPVPTLERWKEITGHVLLERYGMTEIGMALSNPLEGTRMPGHVGSPLPAIAVRLVDEQDHDVPDGEPGQIVVQGPGVFGEYWRRPEETRAAFRNGWFLTGDTAVVHDGVYKILGRTSVDIIKTGGFKVSALEIEDVVRAHPAIADCAVVGVADEEWGERVCLAAELNSGSTVELGELRTWAAERLAPYKIPRSLRCVDSLPRNAMGKVTKSDVGALFAEDDHP